MRRVGIIGAGRFGMALAQSLAESGAEVLLMDRNGSLVQNAASVVTSAVQGDATVARTLEEAGFGECEVAVVAVGSNIEVSTMATANCKELGVPEVIAKATSDLHGKILEKLGADKVIFPDREDLPILHDRMKAFFPLLRDTMIAEGYASEYPDVDRQTTFDD